MILNDQWEKQAYKLADENKELLKKIAGCSQKEEYLSNLLAIIHGDGGHYEVQHGTDEAYKAAAEKIYSRIERLEEAERLLRLSFPNIGYVWETLQKQEDRQLLKEIDEWLEARK